MSDKANMRKASFYVPARSSHAEERWFVVINGAPDTDGAFAGPFKTEFQAQKEADRLNAETSTTRLI